MLTNPDSIGVYFKQEDINNLSDKALRRVNAIGLDVLPLIGEALNLESTDFINPIMPFNSGMSLVVLIEITSILKEKQPRYVVAKILSANASKTEAESLLDEVEVLERVQDIFIQAGKHGSAFQELVFPLAGDSLQKGDYYMMISGYHGVDLRNEKRVLNKLISYTMVAEQYARLFDRDIYMLDLHDGNIIILPDDPLSASLSDFGIVITEKSQTMKLLAKVSPAFDLIASTFNDEGVLTFDKKLKCREFIIRTLAALAFQSFTGLRPYINMPASMTLNDAINFQTKGINKHHPNPYQTIRPIEAIAGQIKVQADNPDAKIKDLIKDKNAELELADWMDKALGPSGYYASKLDGNGNKVLWNEGIVQMMKDLLKILANAR